MEDRLLVCVASRIRLFFVCESKEIISGGVIDNCQLDKKFERNLPLTVFIL